MIHLTFEWLKPAKIKDIHGRIASHSDYDPRTLFVPAEFLNKQTPAHQQWYMI
jgi:DNA mismatch repair protein MSH6